MNTLTTNEARFMRHYASVCGNGYPTKTDFEYLTGDNYSLVEARDLIGGSEAGDFYTKEQVGGFLSSLQEKGILAFERSPDLWWITELGVEVCLAECW